MASDCIKKGRIKDPKWQFLHIFTETFLLFLAPMGAPTLWGNPQPLTDQTYNNPSF